MKPSLNPFAAAFARQLALLGSIAVTFTAPQALAAVTWDGSGTNDASGIWSDGLNWDTDAVPGTLDTAVLTNVTTGSRTVSFDTLAPAGVLQLDLNQTSAAINQVEFLKTATVTNAITLGSAAGTAEIRLSPPTTAGITLTATGGVTLNSGGLLTMQGNNDGTTNQRTSTVAGNVTVSGGTLYVSPSTLTGSANIRNITGSLTMSSGTLSLDPGTAAQTRIQTTSLNISGGAINRGAGTYSQAQLITTGTSNTLSPTTFDRVVSVSLLSGNQAIAIGTAIGEIVCRNTGATGTTNTKTITMSGGATIGRLGIACGSANATSNVVLGSNITATNDPSSSSMPAAAFGSVGNLVTSGIDTAGFTLDLTAARGSGGSTTWTPNITGGTGSTTNWNLINSGTALQGGIKVGNINFSTATQVNVGPGVAIEITGGNSTAINAGGGGTWDAATLLTYSGTAASGTPATLTTNRTIGDLLLGGTGVLQLQAASLANAYQGRITIRRGTLVVTADGLLGGGTASQIKLSDGTSPTNSRIVLQLASGVTLDRPVDVTASLGAGADPNGQRPRISLGGVASAATVSADVVYGLTGPGTVQRLEFTAVDPASVLTVSGQVKAPVGAIAAGGLIINGGNSGTGTVKFTNPANDYSGGTTLVNGTFLITANVPASGASVIGTSATFGIADGATPEAATVSALMDGPYTFSRNTNLASNLSTGGTQYTAVLGMAESAAGSATWAGNITSTSDTRLKTLGLTAPAGGTVVFSGVIGANSGTGTVSVDKAGDGIVELVGINLYEGNTTVSAGTLQLNDNAQIRFYLGAASGTTNSISGAGTAVLNGDFAIDTTAADSLGSGTWTLEDVTSLTGAYGSTFSVVNPDSSPWTDAGGNKWTKVNGAKTWTFDETTGILTLAGGIDYETWIAFYSSITVPADRLPTADPDGDGLINQQEYAFGLNPTTGASVNPITVPLDKTTGKFSYTRRKPSLTGLTYAVNTSTTLAGWKLDAAAVQTVTGTAGDVETVQVTLTLPLTQPNLFVRVQAQ